MARELEEVNASGELSTLVLASKMEFAKRLDVPAFKEGTVWYDENSHALVYFPDKSNAPISAGREIAIRVNNGTASTLNVGQAVHATGASLGGLPLVELAVADSFANALCPGIVSHSIPSGEDGFIMVIGELVGDFSLYNIGDTLYLSTTVPGGVTTTQPALSAPLGLVTEAAAPGRMLVRIGPITTLYTDLTPQVPPPQLEGRVFYDSLTHALSVYSDVDMVLNLGQEEVIRVYNDTGSIIPNATAVRVTGAMNGLPMVAPAMANTYATASVPGIATHSIGIAEEGFITHAGTLGGDFVTGSDGVDFTIGDVVFLSDTVPGGIQSTAPDIVTKIGMVANNTVDGKLIVKIANLATLPSVIGYLTGGTVPGTITGTPTVVDNYSNSGNIVSHIDAGAGEVGVPSTGIYRMNIDVGLVITPANATKTVTMSLIDETDTIVSSHETTLTKNAEAIQASVHNPFEAVAGKVYRLQVSSDNNITVTTVNTMSFDIESLNIR